jgi:hypothetical protein
MDRHRNASKPPWDARAKDIRLRLDRSCPKLRSDVEPGQCSAEIVGKRRQRTTMHMAAVVEMTVIDIEFADQLFFSAWVMRMPKCFGMPERAGARVIWTTNPQRKQRTILTAASGR